MSPQNRQFSPSSQEFHHVSSGRSAPPRPPDHCLLAQSGHCPGTDLHAGDLVTSLGPGTNYGNVEDAAEDIKDNASMLGFSSSGKNGEENFGERWVSFLFEVENPNVKLVAFSDDGVSVTITDLDTGAETTPLTNYGIGQALPDLGQSLKLVPYSFVPGRIYRVETHYLNTFYTGGGDIDGLKFFAFGGNAVAVALQKLIAAPQWSIDPESGPRNEAKIFPGQEVTWNLAINEADSYEDPATGKPMVDPNTGKPYILPFYGTMIAKLKVVNAKFANGDDEMDAIMWGTVKLQFQEAVKIQIPADWNGQPVKISYTVNDPGVIPPYLTGVDPNSNIKDRPLSGEWTWLPGDPTKVPLTVEGKTQKHTPGPVNGDLLWSDQQTRYTEIHYAYGPDANGSENPAGNYTGLTVNEVFGPVSTSLNDKPLNWIQPDWRPATGDIDTAFNAYLTEHPQYWTKSTFQINPILTNSDATKDAYVMKLPEVMLARFLTSAHLETPVTVTVQQDYECPPTKKLTGDMPRSVVSSFDGYEFLPGKEPTAKNPHQQIKAPSAQP